MLFASMLPSPVTVTVHPQTTQIILRSNSESRPASSPANLLVGYIRVQVKRATTISGLTVRFYGEQKLALREGDGPGSALYEVNRKCADTQQCVLSSHRTTEADLRASYVTNTPDSHMHAAPVHSDAHGTNHLFASLPCLTGSNSNSTSNALELQPGEYRFPFKLELPSSLPATAFSPFGSTRYRVTATLRRAWFQKTTCQSVSVSVFQASAVCEANANIRALSHSILGLRTLNGVPPVFSQAAIDANWGLSIYMESPVLFPGRTTKVQLFATSKHCAENQQECSASECLLDLVEFNVAVQERIKHRIEGHKTMHVSQRKVLENTSQCSTTAAVAELANSDMSKQERHAALVHQSVDAQLISAIGSDTLDEVADTHSLSFVLPPKGKGRVQPDCHTGLFDIGHEVVVTARVRVLKNAGRSESAPDPAACTEFKTVTFNVPVVVVPESLCDCLGGVVSLPSYESVERDVLLASTVFFDNANPPPPPPYLLSAQN